MDSNSKVLGITSFYTAKIYHQMKILPPVRMFYMPSGRENDKIRRKFLYGGVTPEEYHKFDFIIAEDKFKHKHFVKTSVKFMGKSIFKNKDR